MANWESNIQSYKKYMFYASSYYRKHEDVRMFAELLLTLGAISVFGLFAIRPTLTTLAGLYTSLNSKKQALALMQEKINNLQTAQTLIEQESESLVLLEQAIPVRPEPDIFVRQIEGLAQKNSLSINNLTLDTVSLIPTINQEIMQSETLKLDLSLTGNYDQLQSFVQDLENIRRPFAISHSQLSFSDTNGNSSLLLSLTGQPPYLRK
ncbi:hypothetical protein A2382_04900 [Candidatus Woesebacteria bacterium RIFOXYB1_FULL_38_16]|uniref:Uncharacterized protein n=1 Tax=Candidatus Woesebacteria bacterium RIFOXYB1_FULL_38_16 TaxID=1802538 RepID=A0A1F8CV88_9BACT|nr:MAG: hypothetical protein A2191_00260 [Candidatus Woesebacteria bacterium RIFOXYA1_FULL_38_9]OGM79996.1 MAG: hypothetical protein A2382_04900 [Candidatus Woesebacteria bacterium RIFOXYB1_FULL_38_16]